MTQPTFPPATESVQDRGTPIPPEALNIAGRALDASIFYQDAFVQACKAAWHEAFPVTCKSITPGKDACGYIDAEGEWAEQKAQFEAFKEALTTEPRGTWALMRRPWRDDPTRASWSVAMSAGGGQVTCPDLSGIVGQPTHAELVRRMVGYEIYTARHCETRRRDEITSLAVLRERGWAVGDVLRNVKTGGAAYSSGTIIRISGPAVVLELRRRGSPRRWTWTGLAKVISFDEAATAAQGRKAGKPARVAA